MRQKNYYLKLTLKVVCLVSFSETILLAQKPTKEVNEPICQGAMLQLPLYIYAATNI